MDRNFYSIKARKEKVIEKAQEKYGRITGSPFKAMTKETRPGVMDRSRGSSANSAASRGSTNSAGKRRTTNVYDHLYQSSLK